MLPRAPRYKPQQALLEPTVARGDGIGLHNSMTGARNTDRSKPSCDGRAVDDAGGLPGSMATCRYRITICAIPRWLTPACQPLSRARATRSDRGPTLASAALVQ